MFYRAYVIFDIYKNLFYWLHVLCSVLQVRTENLMKEKEMIRQAEHRLVREKEIMLVEQRNQSLLLSNLKTIQVWHHSNDVLLSKSISFLFLAC